ncbi:hypothetical protein COO60DRAFT_1702842 [Scenedesmus sp. NREL 46B-D3]|nr:hypothetical protein COO60DRAFT_1702842 [Scenedesmus sp. NREL 46B-D3]
MSNPMLHGSCTMTSQSCGGSWCGLQLKFFECIVSTAHKKASSQGTTVALLSSHLYAVLKSIDDASNHALGSLTKSRIFLNQNTGPLPLSDPCHRPRHIACCRVNASALQPPGIMSVCNTSTNYFQHRLFSASASFTGYEQQHEVHQAGPNICSLPEHALDLVASCLVQGSGSQQNFRQSCRAFRAAGHRAVTATLDLYELCGWGSGHKNVPQQALLTAELCPNISFLTLPSGWRHQNIEQLLHASLRARAWRRLTSLSMHFHALSPSTAAALAQLAPSLSQLTLSLDLAYEQTRSQVWRVRALLQLSQLASLTVEPDLRPEALMVLSGLPRLRQLQLLGTPQHSSHPEASLAALAGLRQLTSLGFHWKAGRTLADAGLLSALTHLQELRVWLSGGGRELPPCSSKPLPGMLEAAGQLTGLTRLELLQGLYMSWDLRLIRHLSNLGQLQVLSLHDSVLCDDELALLAPCSSLQHLRVDTLKLPAIRSTAAAVLQQPGQPAATAAAAAAAGAAALQGVDADAAAGSNTLPSALAALARLKQLEVNMLQLGLWQMDESSKTANCAESLAAAVVRVILQSAGISRGGSGPGGCSVPQLAALLQSLPQLQQLQLWGHAGGVTGKMLASLRIPQGCSSNSGATAVAATPAGAAAATVAALAAAAAAAAAASSSSSNLTVDIAEVAKAGGCLDSPGGRISSPTASRRNINNASWSGEHCQGGGGGVAAAVGDLLGSLGSLLSPTSRIGGSGTAAAAAAAQVPLALPAPAFHGGSWNCSSVPGAAMQAGSEAFAGAASSRCSSSSTTQQCKVLKAGAAVSNSSSNEDEQLVVQLLRVAPQLQVLQLKQCSHLLQGGWVLAARCCGRDGGAAVVVEKQ